MKELITTLVNGKLNLQSSAVLKKAIAAVKTPYTMIYLNSNPVEWAPYSQERMLKIAKDTGAALTYSDRLKSINGEIKPWPVTDYQFGSVREDFDFGAVWLCSTEIIREIVSDEDEDDLKYAALYDLRLRISEFHIITHVKEFLYTELDADSRKSGEKLFDYVNPKNREVQAEMEACFLEHLRKDGALLEPVFKAVDFESEKFPLEASVIIPVKNREKTIEEAVKSALGQKTDFAFNVIVVDNHSSDNTTKILSRLAEENRNLVHIIPDYRHLEIGGCWNEAIMDARCGRFAVQLDSDDLYIDDRTLQKIINAFYEQKTAMIIGSYKLVDFNLKEIPPGIIDHREWTPENGRNNALRINGLGAPRAFYTPIIREIKFPNVSYGEDYAVCLAVSRNYQIGRIYEPLYLCRRWDGNSDSNPDVALLNARNAYKDSLRCMEIDARIV
ncbi:MAG: glycosyltransferase family 2 protein [Dysgonamonadaceae bacterium]|jgi:hypothetical protein|nr:glycosyltransferase family 2 protein [Dysgonamonadaceae bacterium]